MSQSPPNPVRIGILVFPDVTQLDFTGPLQVLSRVPDATIDLVWKTREPVRSDTVLTIAPTATFADCPQLDVICVPGGRGTDALVIDEETLAFVARQAAGARYVTSVCTGSLVLGAAGLLRGYTAATHWSAREMLALFGATLSEERVCIDRNRITGGGVTAGIDFGLKLAAEIAGETVAQAIQLTLEYDPQPPFAAGSPGRAPQAVRDLVMRKVAASNVGRRAACEEAARRLPA